MIKLELNELIEFENRLYRVGLSDFSNGKMQGHRVILKLLREKELNELILNGGLIENENKS